MSDVRDRLKALRERAGISIRDMARASGLESSGYNHYETRFKGEHIPMAKAQVFARALAGYGIPEHEVLELAGVDSSGEPIRVDDPANAPDGAEMVPVYDVAASAGHGALVDYEAQATSLAFPPDYLKHLTSSNPKHLAIISVKGESMEPTLIDDDIVLLDRSKVSLAYDGLFVLRMDGALHVKRVGRGSRAGLIRIVSDNKLYDAFEREIDAIDVIGKVLWYGRKV